MFEIVDPAVYLVCELQEHHLLCKLRYTLISSIVLLSNIDLKHAHMEPDPPLLMEPMDPSHNMGYYIIGLWDIPY